MKHRISLSTAIGDPQIAPNRHIYSDTLFTNIDAVQRNLSHTKGADPTYSNLFAVRILVLQHLYNLADDVLECQLIDYRS